MLNSRSVIPFLAALALFSGVCSTPAAESKQADWTYLDNGQVRLGVKKTSGACIGYFSQSGSERNLLNHWDQGRFIQQSYYGSKDGSMWADKPWRWNPVQGGDYKGHPAKLLNLMASRTTLYAKSEGIHWASGTPLPEVILEQWITLTGRLAHVRFRMTYSGTNSHPKCDQEVPAFFVEPDLKTLVLYDGARPWTGAAPTRSQPGWPNESRRMAENWAAYVDKDDFGVGGYVPVATNLTCYRFGDDQREHGSCSYFAPLVRFAITPSFKFEYDLYLALGTTDEIRKTFSAIHEASMKGKP